MIHWTAMTCCNVLVHCKSSRSVIVYPNHIYILTLKSFEPVFKSFRYVANSKTDTFSSPTDSTKSAACCWSPVKGCLLVIASSHWHFVCCLYECVWVCGLCSALLCVCSSQFIFPLLEAGWWCVLLVVVLLQHRFRHSLTYGHLINAQSIDAVQMLTFLLSLCKVSYWSY